VQSNSVPLLSLATGAASCLSERHNLKNACDGQCVTLQK